MERTATISSKGQVTLPAELRRGLNVGPGDKITFIKRANSVEIKPSTYDEELSDLRKRAEIHMKRNGTWGTPFKVARERADAARLEEYKKKYGPRA